MRHTVNDVSVPSGIGSPLQAVNSIPKVLDEDLCKNLFYFHIYSFPWFSIMTRSYIYIDFTRVTASRTTCDVTNYVTLNISYKLIIFLCSFYTQSR